MSEQLLKGTHLYVHRLLCLSFHEWPRAICSLTFRAEDLQTDSNRSPSVIALLTFFFFFKCDFLNAFISKH